VGLACEPCRTRGGVGYGFAAVRLFLDRFEPRVGQLEDPLARHVGRDGRDPERPDIDERDGNAPGAQQIANEIGFAPFGVERGEEENGRH
jgi:hypothetical protein